MAALALTHAPSATPAWRAVVTLLLVAVSLQPRLALADSANDMPDLSPPEAPVPAPDPVQAILARVRAAGVLDLRLAWQAALVQDATLRAAQAGAAAGRAGVDVATAEGLPQIALLMSRQQHDLRTNSDRTRLTPAAITEQPYYSGVQTLSVRQPLWQPVQRAAVAQADARAQEAEAGTVQARQQLALRLAEAYFQLQLAEQQMALVDVQTAAHARQLDAARKALAAGHGTRTDVDEAQARLDLDAAETLLARQQYEHARLQLQQLVGEPVRNTVPLDTTHFDGQPPQLEEMEAWSVRALRTSPELQGLQARRDAAAQELAKAQARHQPTLDLVVQHSRVSPESSTRLNSRTLDRTVGLQFNLPLYAGGGHDAGIRQAQAELQRQEAQLEAARLDVQLRLQQTHRSVEEGLVRVKALQQAVRSSEQLARSVSRSYEAGVRTTVDVLNAEQQLAEARRNLIQVRLQTLLLHLRLQAMAGEIDDECIDRLSRYFNVAASPAAQEGRP